MAALNALAGRLRVVIPALNEAPLLGATLEHLRRAAEGPMDVVVADGQSRDGTADIAACYGAAVVASRPGRGAQMNAGAASTAYEAPAALMFLHADTLPPEGFDRHVREALAQPGVAGGAFAIRLDAPGRAYRMIAWGINVRSRVRQLPYGDQAIFLRAETFAQAGGFPEYPVMEDYAFVRTLRRMGRIAVVDVPAGTSARRWQAGGVLRTTLLNQFTVAAYHLGVPLERIAAWRRGKARVESPLDAPPVDATAPNALGP